MICLSYNHRNKKAAVEQEQLHVINSQHQLSVYKRVGNKNNMSLYVSKKNTSLAPKDLCVWFMSRQFLRGLRESFKRLSSTVLNAHWSGGSSNKSLLMYAKLKTAKGLKNTFLLSQVVFLLKRKKTYWRVNRWFAEYTCSTLPLIKHDANSVKLKFFVTGGERLGKNLYHCDI